MNDQYDAIVIGGGPAGAIAALCLARKGRRTIVLEKAAFPRFHVGESFLPATLNLLRELGLEPALRELPHVPKFGAEFAMGGGGVPLEIDFADGFCEGSESFNIERAPFDAMLLREAEKAGADVRVGTGVKQILSLADGDVKVQTDAGEIHGKYLLDASGQGTVVARHLGTRRAAEESHLQKVAYFGHFQNVSRLPGRREGFPLIAMMDEGWFWLIPLDKTRSSIGMVMDADVARRISKDEQIPADQMLQWGIARCPAIRNRTRDAVCPPSNGVAADFSYRCKPYAGDGYFLIGDSATFMDPIFSTGVSIALCGARTSREYVDEILNARLSPKRARAKYISMMRRSTDPLFDMIHYYYDHSFRELLLHGRGPMQMHKAVIGVLAGNVFPRPPWKIRWRLWLFDQVIKLNRRKQVVPRRRRFSILKSAVALPPTSATP